MILISACLIGAKCKYNGGDNMTKELCELVHDGVAIPVCPEQLGGLATPRPPAEITGGVGSGVLEGHCRVIDSNGKDVCREFIKGAEETLRMAKLANAKAAILKARSPSCGFGRIYDGSFTGKLICGNGVTAELLKRNGIKVMTEEDAKLCPINKKTGNYNPGFFK